MTSPIQQVMAGEKIKYGHAKKVYSTLEPCAERWTGNWVCVTHNQPFFNQFEKDVHIHNGTKHRLVWWCSGHGPEQPLRDIETKRYLADGREGYYDANGQPIIRD